ncbi:unnamed protein product [Mytilus coruscus]|uniref:Reverse transcriptase domain-containing protein n=1 Tax=Mytilus coruscus TaxID=42192 RepID=A0A6J8ECI5_MYTCO|nr:unnamed protein product [Mytilus coruscus]
METGGEDSDTYGDCASGCDEVTAEVHDVDSSVCDEDESSDERGIDKINEETFWDDDYVNGIRHMYEGVIYESNVENDELEGYIVKIDQEKAFDRESHEYIFKILKQFGFGDVFIKWIEIFYTRINSCVKCNEFLTPYFGVDNLIRYGCPISALLYVLAAEPLQCNIRENVNISGIKIPHTTDEALIFQHADDTALTVSDKSSIIN